MFGRTPSVAAVCRLSKRSFSSDSRQPARARQLRLPVLLQQAIQHAQQHDRILCSDWPHPDGRLTTTTYHQAISKAALISSFLRSSTSITHTDDSSGGCAPSIQAASHGHRLIAQLSVPGWEYISTLWGTWGAGFGSVPLSLSQPVSELEYVLGDAQPEVILVGGGGGTTATTTTSYGPPTRQAPNLPALLQAAKNLDMSDRVVHLSDVFLQSSTPNDQPFGNPSIPYNEHDAALILYTSGTTGKPKGVVLTHRNVYHQVTDLVSSWKWQPNDVALHVLPLHHVHGVINVLCCAAYVGARIDFRPFDAHALWKDWANDENDDDENRTLTAAARGPVERTTVFMAVPTIYAKLLEAATDSLSPDLVQRAVYSTLRPMRLQVSGSAALPVTVLERWKALTGQTLLERYGMTEFGMALSNPYDDPEQRRPGHVGLPLPSVQVRLVAVDDNDNSDHDGDAKEKDATTSNDDTNHESIIQQGLLQVKGPTVFREYLNRPQATKEAFDEDGYFHTGDVAEYNQELNSYRILGRASVDILKVGGYADVSSAV